MKPKELSEKTGLKERTIRFYEEQGLLMPKMEQRNGRNFRDYSDEDVRQLKAIATLRRAGFTLEEIRQMMESDKAVETIYPDYLRRVCREADTAVQLREAAVQISPLRNGSIYACAAIGANHQSNGVTQRGYFAEFWKI